MKEEQKGEYIGQLVSYEKKLHAINDEIFGLSCKAEKLVDSLCKIDNEEYLKIIQDLQYSIGKMKGLLK